MTLPGLDNLQAAGFLSGQLASDIANELEIPLSAALPSSPNGTRSEAENLTLVWLARQKALPIVALPAEPLLGMTPRLTLHGQTTHKVDDILVAVLANLQGHNSFLYQFYLNIKGAEYQITSLKKALDPKLPMAKRLKRLRRLRKALCSHVLDFLIYSIASQCCETPVLEEFWVSFTSIKYFLQKRVQFDNVDALKDCLGRETGRYTHYIRSLLRAIFPQEAQLLELTEVLAQNDLQRSPQAFGDARRVAGFLRGHLQRAKRALQYDGRLSTLHARLLAMPAFQDYRKRLPARFTPTKFVRPYEAPVDWAAAGNSAHSNVEGL